MGNKGMYSPGNITDPIHNYLWLKYKGIRLTCKLPWGGYPKSLHSLNMKNGRSDTPLS